MMLGTIGLAQAQLSGTPRRAERSAPSNGPRAPPPRTARRAPPLDPPRSAPAAAHLPADRHRLRARVSTDGCCACADCYLLSPCAYGQCEIYHHFGSRSKRNSFANLGLESFFLPAKSIISVWQTGEMILTRDVSEHAPLQSSALVYDRDLGSGNNSTTWVIDGTENSCKLGLRPGTYRA